MEYDCREKIVRESLHYVACIDDAFVEAYECSEEKERVEFTKGMYRTIEQACGCHVEMLPYSKDIEQERIDKCLENKDLLILDWELAGKNYILPLKILVKAHEMRIPFVCIYTHEPDLDNVCQMIRSYFSGYSYSDVDNICDQWTDAGVMESDFKAKVLELNPLFEEKPNTKKIIDNVKEMFDEDKEALDKLNKLEYTNKKAWIPLWLKWSNAILSEKRLCEASNPKDGTIVIEGMVVCCLSKPASQTEEAIGIEELIPTIATKITKAPNSIFNLVWLHYSNALRFVLQSRSQLFSEIDDNALKYFSKELLEQGDAVYDNWMKELFRDEIMDRLNAIDADLPKEILDNIKEQCDSANSSNLAEELVALNEKIMVNHMYSSVSHNIDFGDVFVTVTNDENSEEIYWLCVTPKCDCLRSEEKISNNYLFIKGKRMDNPHQALKHVESKYRSFIKHGEKIVPVDWKTKLISVYFEEGNNTVENNAEGNKGICSGKEYVYTYLCNVKENYVQRVANETFAESNRVGVSLAQIR